MAAKKSTTTPAFASAEAPAELAAAATETMTAAAEPIAMAPEPIEDVVGVSPVVETITAHMAELPKRISGIAEDLTKSQTEVKTIMDKAIKTTEEMVSFGQGNMEAIIKSSQIWAAGMQDMGKHLAATAQAQLDEAMASVKALSSVKSLKEAMDLQAAMAKTAMDKMMAETGKLTDASMKLAEQTMAPITARITLATEKFGRTA